jgi:Cu+-exporting ATPase
MAKKSLHLNISGMTCVNCSNAVEKVTKKLPGVLDSKVSFASAEGEFEYDDTLVEPEKIIAKIKKLGYGASKDVLEFEKQKLAHFNSLKRRLLVAAILAAVVMLLHKFTPFGNLNNWIIFILASIVQFYSGATFYTHAYSSLLNRNYDMNVLIALGTSAAYFYSLSVLFFGDFFPQSMRFVYFDGAVMIIAFVLLGKYLEERSKAKATNALEKLMDLSPKTANLLQDNQEVEVLASALQPDDIVVIRSGEGIPSDGVIIEGEAEINSAMLTGESMPVFKQVGDLVMAGTIVHTGFLKVRITKHSNETMLSNIVSLLASAQNQKMPIGRIADKISNIFVPTVVFISIGTFLLWWFFSDNLLVAFLTSISVLIISCPCALGLATPIAIVTAVGKGASMGILLKNPEVLEIMKEIKYAVFDKTGTLTKGEISIVHVSEELKPYLALVGSIESKSEHPISKSIVKYIKEQNIQFLDDEIPVQILSGKGIVGEFEDKKILLGNEALMHENDIKIDSKIFQEVSKAQQNGKGAVFAAINSKVIGYFLIQDCLKPEAKELIKSLKSKGITTAILTGDNEATAKHIAKEVDVDLVHAGVLPHEKLELIKTFSSNGKVLFVGDGINDALPLKQADIGIALKSGSDIAKDAGDIVLIGSDLRLVEKSLLLSFRTIRTIKQNLFWAFVYNIIGIPLAAGALYPAFGILLTPMYASMAMSISSVTVVLNALRLKWTKF